MTGRHLGAIQTGEPRGSDVVRPRAAMAVVRAPRLDFNSRNRWAWVARSAERIPPGSRVLDVGAGTGQYRPLFAHCQYEAQDFGQEPGTIGHYTELDYECDITDIPAPDGSFDVVVCTEVLEHVPEPIKAVREISRVLREGGTLLISAPLGAYLHQEPFHFYGGYTPHWYHRFLPEAGLEVLSVERNGGFFSHFGQEARRFTGFVSPRRTGSMGLRRIPLVVVWAAMLPLGLALASIGPLLDRLRLEQIATVGYHVVAKKGASASGRLTPGDGIR